MAYAKEKLESAKLLLDAGKYKDSIGRSYYAIFTSDKKYSKYVQSVFQIRNSCDYDDFFIASRQDAEEQYQKAVELYEEVKAFLEK